MTRILIAEPKQKIRSAIIDAATKAGWTDITAFSSADEAADYSRGIPYQGRGALLVVGPSLLPQLDGSSPASSAGTDLMHIYRIAMPAIRTLAISDSFDSEDHAIETSLCRAGADRATGDISTHQGIEMLRGELTKLKNDMEPTSQQIREELLDGVRRTLSYYQEMHPGAIGALTHRDEVETVREFAKLTGARAQIFASGTSTGTKRGL